MQRGMVARRAWMGLSIEAAPGKVRIQWVKPWRRNLMPADTWPMHVGSVPAMEYVWRLAAVLRCDVRLLVLECMCVLYWVQLSGSAREEQWRPVGVWDDESLGGWEPRDNLPSTHHSVWVPAEVAQWALMTTRYWGLYTTWVVPVECTTRLLPLGCVHLKAEAIVWCGTVWQEWQLWGVAAARMDLRV